MTLAQETEMAPSEIDSFLSNHETGVLSLAKAESPYAIPISYGYDASTRTFYVRLVSAPESEKRAFLDSEPEARIVVYDENDDGTQYESVVASGALEEIDPDTLSVEQIEQYGRAKRPLFEIWGQERDDLNIQLYEFEPSELSGRETVVNRDES
jgi:nitroimidazol reductase NimA-like FMN-containing flavoprotein (pyridoxamine 5'-phosphate oxidase superfamily)